MFAMKMKTTSIHNPSPEYLDNLRFPEQPIARSRYGDVTCSWPATRTPCQDCIRASLCQASDLQHSGSS